MIDLNEIHDPSFLKSMNVHEMEELAAQIREFLIHSISRTGGHLASNLGVVELTIALHYAFSSPRDKIFFDVGHQCYTHKILTGRASRFSTLRQFHGLSGFEKRSESEHDVWEAGHSSTSLSAALGMAAARDIDPGSQYFHIVPVIGDGALGSGMALEALNQIGAEKKNIIIVFNDNNMSISRNVGAMSQGFSRLRTSKTYTGLKEGVKRSLRSNGVGQTIYTGLKTFKDGVKYAIIHGGIFEEFGLDYIGPVDGHDIKELIRVFQMAKTHEGPIVVHVITQKGKGYLPCEVDREGRWHGVGAFDVTTGKPLYEVPEGYQSWSGLMSNTVRELAEDNPDIIALTPAMINGSSLRGFFAEFPERSYDCGIAEEHAATMAAGIAIAGKRPYLTIYSSFLQRAYDQINHDIARMDLPVVIGIDRAGLVGEDGETHHGIFDIGLLTPLPNIILAQPRNAAEARNLLYTAFHQEHPFFIRFPKGTQKNPDSKEFKMIPTGSWEMINQADTNRVILLTYGDMVDAVLEKVQANNLPITVVNCRFFKPLDELMLDQIASYGKKIVVYETDLLTGGLGSLILDYYNRKKIQADVRRFGLGDLYIKQGSLGQLRRENGIDINTVLEASLEE